ncbi:MAG TPA: hypothetical protein VGH81_08595 [Rudaea sp.]|jgi:CRISPR-associated protein Csy1
MNVAATDIAAQFAAARQALARGAAAEAMPALRAIAAAAADAQMLCDCAELFLAAGCDEDATALAARIAQAHPATFGWGWHFAGHMRAKGDLDASDRVLGALRDAAGSAPSARMRAELGLALGLPAVYSSTAELAAVRARFEERIVEFVEKYTPAELARIGADAEDVSWVNFLLAYHGLDDRSLQTRFGDWLAMALASLLQDCVAHPLPARPRPRLALVSSSFHRCTVGFYFAAWVDYLARQSWEVILVHVGTRRDPLTERLAALAHGEVTLAGGIADNARTLRDLAADLIVYPDLGMDRHVLSLAALRLGSRQACAWGHPVTTGLPTIDAFLSCGSMEPPDAQQHYRERLVLLPGLGTRYLSPLLPDTATRAELGLPSARPLYLVPQALFKLHPEHDTVLAEILRRDPVALFVLFELRAPSGALRVRERLLRDLSGVTDQPEAHLHWFPECSRPDYLRINRVCDVMVDSLHWSGGNTTLDALHCGLPVVTCPGRFMRGRQSAAMLRALDCAELIVETPAQLAERAVQIVHDRSRRSSLVAKIAGNLPRLIQSDAPLHALDLALRELMNGSFP